MFQQTPLMFPAHVRRDGLFKKEPDSSSFITWLLPCAGCAVQGFFVDLQALASAAAELLLTENAMRERSETIQATFAPIAAM